MNVLLTSAASRKPWSLEDVLEGIIVTESVNGTSRLYQVMHDSQMIPFLDLE